MVSRWYNILVDIRRFGRNVNADDRESLTTHQVPGDEIGKIFDTRLRIDFKNIFRKIWREKSPKHANLNTLEAATK